MATTGIILGAAYMLYLYWRIAYGTQRNADAAAMPDLNAEANRAQDANTLFADIEPF